MKITIESKEMLDGVFVVEIRRVDPITKKISLDHIIKDNQPFAVVIDTYQTVTIE